MTEIRRKPKKVTKADYARAAEFLQSIGAKAAAVEIEPDKVRIVTTDGQGLTLGADEENLDAELSEFRRKNGYG